MKIIKPDTNLAGYKKIFQHLQDHQLKLIVWQVIPENGKREISESRLNSFELKNNRLHLETTEETNFRPELQTYCYSEDEQLIFKTTVFDLSLKSFNLGIPQEIQLLDEPDFEVVKGICGSHISTYWKTRSLTNLTDNLGLDYIVVKSMAQRTTRDQDFLAKEFEVLSLDEEDRMYADKRESPRARPKSNKWVKVKVEGSSGPQLCRLFDLSQGGMGFLTTSPALFPKQCSIQIVGFDEFDLDDALLGTVVAIRPIDESNTEFKVGVMFNEGQN